MEFILCTNASSDIIGTLFGFGRTVFIVLRCRFLDDRFEDTVRRYCSKSEAEAK